MIPEHLEYLETLCELGDRRRDGDLDPAAEADFVRRLTEHWDALGALPCVEWLRLDIPPPLEVF